MRKGRRLFAIALLLHLFTLLLHLVAFLLHLVAFLLHLLALLVVVLHRRGSMRGRKGRDADECECRGEDHGEFPHRSLPFSMVCPGFPIARGRYLMRSCSSPPSFMPGLIPRRANQPLLIS